MRNTVTLKPLAVVYGLGLILLVAMVGGAVVLTRPMAELYSVLGIESALVRMVATMTLVAVLAIGTTIAAGLALRSTTGHDEATERA